MLSASMTQGREFVTPTATYRESVKMGSGTYGTVYKVYNVKDASIVKALKTFTIGTFEEGEGVPPTTIRELNVLKVIDKHPNVIAIDEIVYPEGDVSKMFFTMELCRGSLKDKQLSMIMEHLSPNRGVNWAKIESKGKLPAEYVREAKLVVWQLLNGVAYSHSWGIAHRDLKPANVMWGWDDTIKIGDFGLARFLRGGAESAAEDGACPQTGEVQTLWYRAAEVLLGDERYGPIVDDWSIGCIMAELFRFKDSDKGKEVPEPRWEPDPLFQSQTEVFSLMSIFQTLGTPEKKVSERYLVGLEWWSVAFPRYTEPSLSNRVFHLDAVGLDLVKRMLCIDPTSRMAARFLLDHPWFDEIQATVRSKMKLWSDNPSYLPSIYHNIVDEQSESPAETTTLTTEEPVEEVDQEQQNDNQAPKKAPRKRTATKERTIGVAKARAKKSPVAPRTTTKRRVVREGRSRSPDRGGVEKQVKPRPKRGASSRTASRGTTASKG
eukprot:GHVN01055023.1.p1 GENE.GHVN01055023.1~~GHVN01055023.1.p1  ORF type:complete len:493 (-),score=48.77 GHVN01055023.1:2609-4087(-)